MYPEHHFLNAQLHDEPIYATRSVPTEELAKAPVLMLVVAKDADTLTALAPTRTPLAARASNPQLSDLYTVDQQSLLERNVFIDLPENY